MNHHKCLSDEEHIKRLVTQADDETNEAYQQRLLERLTGTSDPAKQKQRHELLNLATQLARQADHLKRTDPDPIFFKRVTAALDEVIDSLDDEPNVGRSSLAPISRRGLYMK